MTAIIEFNAVASLVSRSGDGASAVLHVADERVATLAGRLQVAYAARLEQYREQLSSAIKDNARYGLGGRSSAFPEVALILNGREVSIVIDETFYTTLFDLYVFYGWAGVQAVEDAAGRQRSGSGVHDPIWPSTIAFVRFTRNMLALIIRETLIGIEAAAASRIFDRLGQVNRKVADALAHALAFDVVPEEKHVDSGISITIPATYTLRDRQLASALFKAVQAAVGARVAVDEKVAELRRLETELDDGGSAVRNEVMRGWRPPASLGGSAASRRTDAEQKKKTIQADLPRLITNLREANQEVFVNAPFALATLPVLPALFDTQRMENTLGAALFALAKGVDRTASSLGANDSRVRADMLGLHDDDSGPPSAVLREIETLYHGLQLESALLDKAETGLKNKPGYVALLHADTWQELINDDVIGRDSFDYVVAHHWLVALAGHAAASAKRTAAIGSTLAITTAGLSILAVVAPPVAPFAFGAGIALGAFGVQSAMGQLAAFDRDLQLTQLALASESYEALAAIGEIAAHQAAFRNSLTLDVLSQIAMLPLGEIKAAAVVLQAWFFVNDAKTLIEESGGHAN